MSRRGWVLFLTMSAIWGVPYFMIRIAVRQLDPATLVFARTLPAAILLVPIALYQRSFSTLKGKWKWLVAYSVIEFGVPWYFMGSAERHLSSSVTGLLVACVPLVAIALTRVLHPGDIIHRRRLVGLGVGSLGVVLLVGLDIKSGSWMWIAAMGLVVCGYATGPLILGLRLHEGSGLAVVAASVTLVAVAYTPWGVTHWPRHVKLETWLSIAGLSMLCTVGAFLVFFALIQEVGPARSVVVTYFNTAIAVVLGTVGLNEPLTTGLLIGFPLIMVGSILATSSPKTAAELPNSPLDQSVETDTPQSPSR